MPLTVKICGLSEPSTLEAALDAGADMVGFVFFPKSPRHVSHERARELRALVKGRAKTVALTVNADDDALRAIADSLDPDMLQLHGHETPQRVAEVSATFARPVMKAVPIGSPEDLAKVVAYEDVADWLLFDAPPPADAQRPGGNAVAFDWSLLKGYGGRRPWLLAGGLVPETVAGAVAATGARGVDVSSGVESAPGRKDATLIRRFIAAARSA
ncbi:N-(5'-phosphoribosyl)anthranilate isomerase [Beijerinckiaceae bacterium RH AL1]|nr:phosphoribosylanthranilate isomerase [Beijerinckiaceae bacterium]VVB50028.1 N-(5'-phosphoribosyl)anthranilate isomerase [Beijerinckiaceae bacterium RH CH11]VVB50109.1 N-(5'-phosphoribosyl)anthranilate isomerase [Beijerinckiaceae bacterium RH AL8]VVC57201.1 N-(5'-phosphoribosyl)anthranilate isomerase [Beijerinckiaceae bacterium RH AL1]